jgi:hypothetical protein
MLLLAGCQLVQQLLLLLQAVVPRPRQSVQEQQLQQLMLAVGQSQPLLLQEAWDLARHLPALASAQPVAAAAVPQPQLQLPLLQLGCRFHLLQLLL